MLFSVYMNNQSADLFCLPKKWFKRHDFYFVAVSLFSFFFLFEFILIVKINNIIIILVIKYLD